VVGLSKDNDGISYADGFAASITLLHFRAKFCAVGIATSRDFFESTPFGEI
jgi:hypothetical protein